MNSDHNLILICWAIKLIENDWKMVDKPNVGKFRPDIMVTKNGRTRICEIILSSAFQNSHIWKYLQEYFKVADELEIVTTQGALLIKKECWNRFDVRKELDI